MTNVFISYSRKDKAFVQILNQALTDSKYDAWVDWENIPLTADWWAEIEAGIEAADTFIFVISPDSIASQVCAQEIDHAVSNNKRLVPIVRREGFDMSLVRPALGKHNWLFFRETDDFDAAFQSLIHALNTDLGYAKDHTRLLVRALEWEKKHRRDDLLLRGDDLKEAESWLENAFQTNHAPLPTEQHNTYIYKSREVENANQRLAEAGEKAKRLVRIGAGVLAGTVAIATLIGILTIRAFRSLEEAKIATRLQQESTYALDKFESAPLDSLLIAMQNGQELQALVGDRSLDRYPTTQPLVSLKTILDNIQEKNQILAHDSAIWSMDVSDSTSLIATADENGNVRIWEESGQKRFDIQVKPSQLVYVKFSPDGQKLLVSDGPNRFQIWDVPEQSHLITVESEQDLITTVAIHPNSQTIASVSTDGSIALWDMDGQLLQTAQITPMKEEELSGFGVRRGWDEETKTILLTHIFNNSPAQQVGLETGDRILQINDTPLEELARDQAFALFSVNDAVDVLVLRDEAEYEITLRQGTFLTRNPLMIQAVQFTPDGQYIATGSEDGGIRFWSPEDNSLREIQAHTNRILSLDISPDGSQIVTASRDNTVRLWDLQSGNRLANLEGQAFTAVFSPDGQQILTATGYGKAHVWNLEGRNLATFLGHPTRVSVAKFSPRGDAILTIGRDRTLRTWQVSSSQENSFGVHNGYVSAISLDPQGKLLAIAGDQGTAAVWNLNGEQQVQLQGYQAGDLLREIVFSPDGNLIATTSDGESSIRLWTRAGDMKTTIQSGVPGLDVEFSHDGQTVLSTDYGSIAKVWDSQGNLSVELKGHADTVWDGAFSPDGELMVTGSNDNTARLWRRTGELVTVLQGHRGAIWGVSFSHDGDTVATASTDDTARLWNLEGELIRELRGHQGGADSVLFSPDDRYLATTDRAGTARLWNRNGQQLAEFRGGIDGNVQFSPDSETLIVVWGNGYVRQFPVQAESLDDLLQRGCDWLEDYLNYNPAVTDEQRSLCVEN